MPVKLTIVSIGILRFLLVSLSIFTILVLGQHNGNNISKGYDPNTWIAPGNLQKQFPYYISGLDRKGQPVVVIEFGKWDMRKFFEEGGDENVINMYKKQMFYRFAHPEKDLHSEYSTDSYGLIVDYNGFEEKQLDHGPTLHFILSMVHSFVPGTGKKLDYEFAINVNEPGEKFLYNFLAPMFGNLFSKVDVYGTNKETWIPVLLKRIPKESLAPQYGGTRPLPTYD